VPGCCWGKVILVRRAPCKRRLQAAANAGCSLGTLFFKTNVGKGEIQHTSHCKTHHESTENDNKHKLKQNAALNPVFLPIINKKVCLQTYLFLVFCIFFHEIGSKTKKNCCKRDNSCNFKQLLVHLC
jgi:hypothetical protein